MDSSDLNVRDLYLAGLHEIARTHGEEYALLAAAHTMTALLSMVSMATYRLSTPPLFLPPEPAPGPERD